MKVLIATKESEIERIGFIASRYKNVLPMVGLKRNFFEVIDPNLYDVGIGFLFPYKIPKWELAQHPWINFHPGPLPGYGGRNIAYHAIMNESPFFGGTVHWMTEEFDKGDIITISTFGIYKEYNAGDINQLAIRCLYDLLPGILDMLQNDVMPRGLPQSEFGKSYYYEKNELDEEISLSEIVQKRIRALTAGRHGAKIKVNGVNYKVVKDE